VLTDEQWAVLEPLVEACRPPAKVPPSNLRRTIGAILWRHQNGAKWRALPEGFGPWWMAAQTFIRWSRLGVWERMLAMAQAGGVELGMAFLDGTGIRAHQKAAGRGQKGGRSAQTRAREALGRSAAATAPRSYGPVDSGGQTAAAHQHSGGDNAGVRTCF
jgi:transposase